MTTVREAVDAAWQLQRQGNLTQAEKLCREVLALAPQETGAWHVLGLVAYQTGRHQEAVECLSRAVLVQPTSAALQSNLSLPLYSLGRFEEAARCCRRALELRPQFPAAHNNLANVLKDSGHLEEAVIHYRLALAQQPNYPHALSNLGNALHMLRRFDEAIDCYRQALELAPNFPEAHSNLGNVLRDLRRWDEACECYRRALSIDPRYAAALSNLGVALEQTGRSEEAEAALRKALEIQPSMAAAHSNLGTTLRSLGRLDDAISACHAALLLQPNFPEALNNLGTALESLGKVEEAVETYRRATQLNPKFADAYVNLGNALRAMGRLDDAVDACQEALRIKEGNAEALSNLGLALTAAGKLDAAMAQYEKALLADSNYGSAHWNKSLALLLHGDYEEGWKEYEWRWRREGSKPREMEQPLWDGASLKGRTILLWAEQGLGDVLQFVRYVKFVKERGGRVLFECHPPLVRLLSNCEGIDQIFPRGEPLPTHGVHAPLLSLPGIFSTRLETIPADVPYLAAEPKLIKQWRAELKGEKKYKIGIAWQGSPGYKGDRFRSIPLADFAPLAELPGVNLYSLQKGPGCNQLESLADRFSVVDFGKRLDEDTAPFVDTAALIKSLDLVIASDTAVAHLAGALGTPVWVALSYSPDWRWLMNRDDSPWYPSMKLFRQSELGRWDDVFARMVRELQSGHLGPAS